MVVFFIADCLVLENLTCKYQYPCILDLKMGTRAYKDDDTEMEKKRKIEKYAQTTSLSLGARICGMQVNKLLDINLCPLLTVCVNTLYILDRLVSYGMIITQY